MTFWSPMMERSAVGFDTEQDERLFKAMADATRRRILDLLRDRPMTTGELSEHFPVSRFAVMKHLGILEDAGLVLVERRGRQRFNHLNPLPLRQLYDRWIRPFEEEPADQLIALKRRLERGAHPDKGPS